MTNARRQIFGEAVDYALENHQRMLEANRLAEGEEPGSNVLRLRSRGAPICSGETVDYALESHPRKLEAKSWRTKCPP